MRIYDVLDKKRRGEELSDDEIRFIVERVTDNTMEDCQVGAFCMAVCIRGMSEKEVTSLTRYMSESGEKMVKPFDGICVDKHSTGGVSDTTTLIIVPVLASIGVKCAKLSGRGLGYTGGTLDKLECFSGYNHSLSPDEIAKQVEEIGAVMAGQSQSCAPCDKRMYAIRDVSATVESIPLIASSIMSKKLASFADIILLDVKYGDGAFMKDKESAEKLASLMVKIGNNCQRKTVAILSDMNQPLGDSIGCNAEVKEAIQVLKGKKCDLEKISVFICQKLASLALGISEEEALEMIENSISSGRAIEKLKEIVSRQGGNICAIDDPSLLAMAKNEYTVYANKSGYISCIHAKALGEVNVILGGGRENHNDEIDHEAGILLFKRVGDRVEKGEVLIKAYTNKASFDEVISRLENAFEIGESEEKCELIAAFIS